jgi:DNA-binding NarL/FixJ family response regulator
VLEGRPWIQKTGDFKMLVKPGEAGELSDHQKAPGRPSKVTTEQKSKVFRLHSKGISYAKIGKEVGLSKSTVERILGRSAQKTDSESSP